MITLLKTSLPDAGPDGKTSHIFYLDFQPVGTQRCPISISQHKITLEKSKAIQGDRKTGFASPAESAVYIGPDLGQPPLSLQWFHERQK